MKIYAAFPAYGGNCPGAHKSFWNGIARPGSPLWTPGVIIRVLSRSSFLPQAFDEPYFAALNDPQATHFAMLHDDIEAQDGWLDILLEELDRSGADMVSALSPIKSHHGRTSTAIDHVDDPYKIERRITMKEASRLPFTFTAADCGYPDRRLLLNTGCFVCRLDRPWAKASVDGQLICHFTTANRGVVKDGKWSFEMIPEDWFFSRAIQMLGGKVACTRRVKLNHNGVAEYPNLGKWGSEEMDVSWGATVPIGEYPDVEGWLTSAEGHALARLAEGKKVLEIGSYCGRSTIYISSRAESVDCVDPFDGQATTAPQSTLAKFMVNIKKHGYPDKVKFHVARSCDYQTDQLFDFIFVDGDHSGDAVNSDIHFALGHLAPGGLIALHDYASGIDAGVTKVVDQLIAAELITKKEVIDSMAVVKPTDKLYAT